MKLMGPINPFDPIIRTFTIVLLTHQDVEIRRSSINARNTIESLIKLNSIAIINENDTVATKELKFGDNDQLNATSCSIDICRLINSSF